MGIDDSFAAEQADKGQGDDQNQGESDHITRHCFVLCKDAPPIDAARANRIVAEVFGPGYSAQLDGDTVVSVTRGEDAVGVLAFLPMPIPGGEAEQFAANNIMWPEGPAEVAQHTAHVLVTNIGGEVDSAVGSALQVSQLALVALELFNGIGVYWGNASVCHSRAAFERCCARMSESNVPVPIWLRLQPTLNSEGERGLYTLGMDQFGLMDIEIDRYDMLPQELLDFVCNVAQYLILNGPVIKDGDTVGGSETERILVRHQPSLIEPERTVYKIVFDA